MKNFEMRKIWGDLQIQAGRDSVGESHLLRPAIPKTRFRERGWRVRAPEYGTSWVPPALVSSVEWCVTERARGDRLRVALDGLYESGRLCESRGCNSKTSA